MSKILIAYATTEGQTKKIANTIADWLRSSGNVVDVHDTAQTQPEPVLAEYSFYILAGSLHMRNHQGALIRFTQKHADILSLKPSLLLSVSATGSRNDPKSMADAEACIKMFVEQTGFLPTESIPIGGAIKYTKYNFILRAIMKRISAKEGGPTDTTRDHELTDWTALRATIDRFVDKYTAAPPAPVEAKKNCCGKCGGKGDCGGDGHEHHRELHHLVAVPKAQSK